MDSFPGPPAAEQSRKAYSPPLLGAQMGGTTDEVPATVAFFQQQGGWESAAVLLRACPGGWLKDFWTVLPRNQPGPMARKGPLNRPSEQRAELPEVLGTSLKPQAVSGHVVADQCKSRHDPHPSRTLAFEVSAPILPQVGCALFTGHLSLTWRRLDVEAHRLHALASMRLVCGEGNRGAGEVL
jgi:hypothetical protein